MVVTNALGIAFAATLLSASDAGVTFCFPEDGATNTLAWTMLSPASREAVSAVADFEPVPPQLTASFRRAQAEMRRTDVLEADGRLDTSAAAARRVSIRAAFAHTCCERGLSERRKDQLLKRLP